MLLTNLAQTILKTVQFLSNSYFCYEMKLVHANTVSHHTNFCYQMIISQFFVDNQIKEQDTQMVRYLATLFLGKPPKGSLGTQEQCDKVLVLAGPGNILEVNLNYRMRFIRKIFYWLGPNY